jgi:hypothetical protein
MVPAMYAYRYLSIGLVVHSISNIGVPVPYPERAFGEKRRIVHIVSLVE